jgi:hypothetical protein
MALHGKLTKSVNQIKRHSMKPSRAKRIERRAKARQSILDAGAKAEDALADKTTEPLLSLTSRKEHVAAVHAAKMLRQKLDAYVVRS